MRVGSSADDAEEGPTGSVDVNSSDLELTYDLEDQIVGMRFNQITISPGQVITRAYIQFQADEARSVDTNLTIQGEDNDYANAFNSVNGNISNRSWTTASIAQVTSVK